MRYWTDQEAAFLADNYTQIPTEEISQRLNRPISGIRHKAVRLGLSEPRPALEVFQLGKDTIVGLYVEEGLSIRKIASLVGHTHNTVARQLSRWTSLRTMSEALHLARLTTCHLACDTNSSQHRFLFGSTLTLLSPLGDGCCLICFNSDPFERDYDHVFGRDNDTIIQLCPNCHRVKTFYPWLLEGKLRS